MSEILNIISINKTPTIQQLRSSGWKVRVIHGYIQDVIFNHVLHDKLFPHNLQSKLELSDRFTFIELTSPQKTDHTGITFCSKKDRYDRKLGNRIALGRAFKKYINSKYVFYKSTREY